MKKQIGEQNSFFLLLKSNVPEWEGGLRLSKERGTAIKKGGTVEPGFLALEFFMGFFAFKFGGNELMQGWTLSSQQVD